MAGKRNKSKSPNLSEEDKRIRAMITALEDEQRLNDWELGFVADVAERWENGNKLHPNSVSKLKQVYDKYN